MRKLLLFSSICIITVLILNIVFVYLYCDGRILCDDEISSYKKASINIKLTEEGKKPIYSEGYFISKDKVATLSAKKLTDKWKIEPFDMYGNTYTVKGLRHFDGFSVIYLNEECKHKIYYRNFITKYDKIAITLITNDHTLKVYDIESFDNNYVKCNGTVERISGGPVLDSNGRVIGLCTRRPNEPDVFYVYKHSEIIKKVILSEIKDFFTSKLRNL